MNGMFTAIRVRTGGGHALVSPQDPGLQQSLQHLLENSGHPVHLYPQTVPFCPLQAHLIQAITLHMENHSEKEALLIHLQDAHTELVSLFRDQEPLPLKLDLHRPALRSGLPELPWDRLISPLGPLLNVRSEPGTTQATAQLASKQAGQRVYGVGRADQVQASRITAVLEALERLGGLFPDPSRNHIEARMGELPGQVLDPRDLPLYSPAQYQQPGFPCNPFDEDNKYTWVQGVNLQTLEPVWIEESQVYYGPLADPLILNTSSGCAIGQTLEEATLYAFLELAERDAAMRWWQQGSRAPRWRASFSAEVLDSLEPLIRRGYEVSAHDLTTEMGLPVCLLVAFQKHWDGVHPAALCATAAHLDPAKALLKAAQELQGMVHPLTSEQLEKAACLHSCPEDVQTLEDHLLAYALPEAQQAIKNRLSSEEAPVRAAWNVTDLASLLEYTRKHCDLYVVLQNHPILTEQQLNCVRVLSPQVFPITYGHLYQRTWAGQVPKTEPHPFT